jgi:hypothetical protein
MAELFDSDLVLFLEIPRPISMEHHMRKAQWETRHAVKGGEEALIWWWGSRERMFWTVAEFQPRRGAEPSCLPRKEGEG